VITVRRRFGRRWLWSVIFGTVLGAGAFSLLVAWAGIENIWYQTAEIDGRYLFAYVGLTVGTYLLRAWRFRLLIGRSATLAKLYGIVSIHNLMVNLLPLSGGELSYPLLLKYCGISSRLGDGLPSLILARLQDILLSSFLLGAALVWVGRLSSVYVERLMNVFLLALLVFGIGIIIYRTSASKLTVCRRARIFLSEIFASIKNLGAAVWLQSFAVALLARSTSIIATFYLIQAVGVSLSFPTVFLICSAYVFLPLLPVNTVAGLGITEAVLVAFFVAGGIDERTAVVASIHVHVLQLAVAVSLGLFGSVYLHSRARQKGTELLAS
jgi:uncharacterized membrane protein YbhN (UPF0104 family)